METSLWVALIGAGGTVLAAAATAILTHIFKPKSEPTEATAFQDRPSRKRTGSAPPAKTRVPLVSCFLMLVCAVGVIVFLGAGGGLFLSWKNDADFAASKAKAERARVVLSCEDKPVIKIKKGSNEVPEVPAFTIKVERIECRGDVVLRVTSGDYHWEYEKISVPDGQNVVTWKIPTRPGSIPKIGIHVIRVEGELNFKYTPYSTHYVKGGVDLRVEVIEAPGK